MVCLYVQKNLKKNNFLKINIDNSGKPEIIFIEKKKLDFEKVDYFIFSSLNFDKKFFLKSISDVMEQTSQISFVTKKNSEHNLQQIYNKTKILELMSSNTNDLFFFTKNIFRKLEITL